MSQATWKKTATPLTPRLIRLLREAALYILGAAALFLLISLWTYQPADSAWSHRGPTIVVANAGGRVGAWFADALYGLFGYVAYLFPVMLAVAGWRVYLHRKDIEPVGLRQRLIVGGGFVLALIGACGLASMHFAQAMTGMPFASGGWFGNVIGAGLASAFNFTGATLLLLALFLAGVTLFTGLSWLRIMDAAGRLGFALVAWARAAAAAMIDRIIGMRKGDEKNVTIRPEDAYGMPDPKNIIEVPLANLPNGTKAGDTLYAGGQPVRVVEIRNSTAVIDTNHFLAGKTLIFRIKIVDIVKPGPK